MESKKDKWSKTWDAHHSKKESPREQFYAICSLLSEYAHSDTGGIYGKMSRFVAGNWNSNHGDAVGKALEIAGVEKVPHFSSGSYGDDEDLMTKELVDKKYEGKINTLVAAIQNQIGNKEINPDGDFAAVISVIQDKTGVDFALQTDASSTLRKT